MRRNVTEVEGVWWVRDRLRFCLGLPCSRYTVYLNVYEEIRGYIALRRMIQINSTRFFLRARTRATDETKFFAGQPMGKMHSTRG